jgi:hypothetical protein
LMEAILQVNAGKVMRASELVEYVVAYVWHRVVVRSYGQVQLAIIDTHADVRLLTLQVLLGGAKQWGIPLRVW